MISLLEPKWEVVKELNPEANSYYHLCSLESLIQANSKLSLLMGVGANEMVSWVCLVLAISSAFPHNSSELFEATVIILRNR